MERIDTRRRHRRGRRRRPHRRHQARRRAGRSVVVLEARDRVGGRLWTDDDRRRHARDRRPVGLARPGRAHRDARRPRPRDLLALPRGRERLHRQGRRAPALRGRDLPGAGEDRGRDRRPHREARRARRADRPRRSRGRTRSAKELDEISFARLARDADRRRRGAPEHRHVHRRGDAHQARPRVLGAAGAAHGGLRRARSRTSSTPTSSSTSASSAACSRCRCGLAERLGDAVRLGQAGAHDPLGRLRGAPRCPGVTASSP